MIVSGGCDGKSNGVSAVCGCRACDTRAESGRGAGQI